MIIYHFMTRQQFLDKAYPEPNTGCWLWVGKTNWCGYGELHKKDNEYKMIFAHRYSYAIHKGLFDENLKVLHTCDQPCCINPDHLFLGTQQDNISDMDAKKRRKCGRGVNHGHAKINNLIAIEIKKMYRHGKYRQIDVAKHFGISRSVVSKVVNGAAWKHVEGIGDIPRFEKRYGGYVK